MQMEEGTGVLRLPGDTAIESVDYRFEVWHQMVDGFPGPFRAEGELNLPADEVSRHPTGQAAVLVLEDGRFLSLRLSGVGTLLAHEQPSTVEPPWPGSA